LIRILYVINLNCLHRFIQNKEIVCIKKINDLIFVICNLKFNDNQVKKQANDFEEVSNDLSSNDDWIILKEKHVINDADVINNAIRRKNSKENERDDEEIFNDTEIESHEDLEIQNVVNLDNSRSLKLNIVNNIGVDICTSS